MKGAYIYIIPHTAICQPLNDKKFTGGRHLL